MCIIGPHIDPPTLGLGLSLAPPALPAVSFSAELCCKLLRFSIVPPPSPLPPLVLNAAVLAALTPIFAAINTYLDAIPLSCPLE